MKMQRTVRMLAKVKASHNEMNAKFDVYHKMMMAKLEAEMAAAQASLRATRTENSVLLLQRVYPIIA
jgi:hypothetical protein